MQKKEDKNTCLSRNSFVKNPERKNGSGKKRCRAIHVERDQSQCEQLAHYRKNSSPKNVECLNLREGRKHSVRQREEYSEEYLRE